VIPLDFLLHKMEILLVHLCIRTSVFYLHFTSRHRQKKKKKKLARNLGQYKAM